MKTLEIPFTSVIMLGDPRKSGSAGMQQNRQLKNTGRARPPGQAGGLPYEEIDVEGLDVDAILEGAPLAVFYGIVLNSGDALIVA